MMFAHYDCREEGIVEYNKKDLIPNQIIDKSIILKRL